jgi:hypothetical protein
MYVVGTGVGLLIGVVGGTVFLLLLRTSTRLKNSVQQVVTLTGAILALSTFFLGGSWAGSTLLKQINPSDLPQFINAYIISVACSFFLFCSYPAFRWIKSLADELGSGGPKS